MAVPQTSSASALPPVATFARDMGVALSTDHPLVRLAWLLAGVAIAAGLGPWISQHAGVMLPAFALVRTRGRAARA